MRNEGPIREKRERVRERPRTDEKRGGRARRGRDGWVGKKGGGGQEAGIRRNLINGIRS